MNILLVNPTRLDSDLNPVKYRKAFIPPLSLAILNSLTPEIHSVQIVNDVTEKIDFSGSYDLVGITAMTSQIERAYQIADKFRNRGIKVVIGGVHTSVVSDEILQHADAIVIGEAEELWELILEDCENGSLKPVYQNKTFPELNRLIVPKWTNANLKIYPKPPTQKMPMMPLFITRGCPMGCDFCSVSEYYGKSYRVKPLSNVLKEIDDTGARSYFFVDDNFFFNVDYSREFLKEIKKKNIRWLSQSSTNIINHPDIIDLAGKAGCSYLFIGMESINKACLKTANKGFNNVDRYGELIERIYRAGIVPILSFIFGFDDDTPDQFGETIKFLSKYKNIYSIFWILTPIPGTGFSKKMEDEGRILKDTSWSKYNGTNLVFEPKGYSIEKFYNLYWKAFQEDYSMRNYLKKIVRTARITKSNIPQLFENINFLTYFKRKVDTCDHPFSGGISRIN